MNKILIYLAYNSYFIIRILFGLVFLTAVILGYFVYDYLPNWFLITFFFVSGIFIGYTIAYYSIKYLHYKNSIDSN